MRSRVALLIVLGLGLAGAAPAQPAGTPPAPTMRFLGPILEGSAGWTLLTTPDDPQLADDPLRHTSFLPTLTVVAAAPFAYDLFAVQPFAGLLVEGVGYGSFEGYAEHHTRLSLRSGVFFLAIERHRRASEAGIGVEVRKALATRARLYSRGSPGGRRVWVPAETIPGFARWGFYTTFRLGSTIAGLPLQVEYTFDYDGPLLGALSLPSPFEYESFRISTRLAL